MVMNINDLYKNKEKVVENVLFVNQNKFYDFTLTRINKNIYE